MTTFTAPPAGGGDQLKLADIIGHHVIVRVTSYEENVPTVNGPANAVRVNVADLNTGTSHTDVLWFPKFVVGQLRSQIGKLVLAKVGQGIAQPGKSAPWVLENVANDPAVTASAERWMAANPGILDDEPKTQSAPTMTAADLF
jgi:hypothetical protein